MLGKVTCISLFEISVAHASFRNIKVLYDCFKEGVRNRIRSMLSQTKEKGSRAISSLRNRIISNILVQRAFEYEKGFN